jgi:hypothetical protein
MAVKDEMLRAQEVAARAAVEAFATTFVQELEKAGCLGDLSCFSGTSHELVSMIITPVSAPMLVRTIIRFDNSREAVAMAGVSLSRIAEAQGIVDESVNKNKSN